MKRQLVLGIVCLLLATFKSFGQFGKSDKLASLTIAPYPTTSNGEKDFGIIIKGDVEFFLMNRLSLVTTGFYSSNTAFRNDSGLGLNAYGVIPSLQYYIVNKEKLSVHLLAGYGFGFTDRTIGSAQNSAMTIVSLGGGVSYKVGERLFLKLQLPYFKAQNISFGFAEVEGVAPFLGLTYGF